MEFADWIVKRSVSVCRVCLPTRNPQSIFFISRNQSRLISLSPTISFFFSIAVAIMAELGTFCGLSSCTNFIFSTPWQCPNCRNIPLGGIAGHQSNVNYCSLEHLDLGVAEHLYECSERIKLRTMARAAEISALVFHCVQQRIWPTEYVIGLIAVTKSFMFSVSRGNFRRESGRTGL